MQFVFPVHVLCCYYYYYCIYIIVSALIAAAPTLVLLAGAQGRTIDAVEALKQSPKYVFNYVGLYFLTSLVLLVSFLLFIIPFFIFSGYIEAITFGNQ